MLKRFAANTLFVFRHQINWLPASNIHIYQSLRFKKNRLEIDEADQRSKTSRPKTVPQPKITLLGPENDISVVTLDVASKMCDRRGMKLVKIIDIDTKTQRPVYKMLTTNQFLKEDNQNHQKKNDKKLSKLRGEKTMMINCRIGKHDLESKLNNIHKWLIKMNEVRVTVTGDRANEITDQIIEMTKEYSKVVQKREKGDSIKFQLLPQTKT